MLSLSSLSSSFFFRSLAVTIAVVHKKGEWSVRIEVAPGLKLRDKSHLIKKINKNSKNFKVTDVEKKNGLKERDVVVKNLSSMTMMMNLTTTRDCLH